MSGIVHSHTVDDVQISPISDVTSKHMQSDVAHHHVGNSPQLLSNPESAIDNAVVNSEIDNSQQVLFMTEVQPNADDGVDVLLEEGIQMSSWESIYHLYQEYAKKNGFAVVIRSGKKDDDGQFISRTFVCHRGRLHKSKSLNGLRPRSSGRIGCMARLCCRATDNCWNIIKFQDLHNHELNPTNVRFIRQHRIVDAQLCKRLQFNDNCSIKATTNVCAVAASVGGYENLPCLQKDCLNYLDMTKRQRVMGGDAEAVYKMFIRMKEKDNRFFYALDWDEQGRLKNVFWADARSRAAYVEFGDVVTFDTTYLVNKYDMPLALFVGVNHHAQSTLLGCALLTDETTESFCWLFRKWLTCMNNVPPEAIITDEWKSIDNAIKTVFPNARHRLCLWHILRKFPEKFDGHKAYKKLKSCFMGVVYDSNSKEEFDVRWSKMLDEYNVRDNAWMVSLFEQRPRWAPTFVRETFWAGMSTTQKSEGMNAFFDGYVHAKSSLSQFVEQYEKVIREKIEREVHMDFLSSTTSIPLVTRFDIEKLFQKAYTNTIFRLVQRELTSTMYCDVLEATVEGGAHIFKVSELGQEVNISGLYIVTIFGQRSEAKCSCKLLDFRGIVCRHLFKILTRNKTDNISKNIFVRRWRKDIIRCHSKIRLGNIREDDDILVKRTRKLESAFYQAMDYAVDAESKFEYLYNLLQEAHSTLSCEGGSHIDNVQVGMPSNTNRNALHSPLVTRQQGRPFNKKLKSRVEEFQCHRQKTPIATPTSEVAASPQQPQHVIGSVEVTRSAGTGAMAFN